MMPAMACASQTVSLVNDICYLSTGYRSDLIQILSARRVTVQVSYIWHACYPIRFVVVRN